MKDIDFDELDKAVNSLMAGVPSNGSDYITPATDAPADDTVTVTTAATSTTTVSATPIVNLPTEEPTAPSSAAAPQPIVTAATSVPPRPAVPATRRGGRFMDMVHTSSDMKPRVPAASVPSREGATITPPSAPTPAPIINTPSEEAQVAQTSPVVMPDPIDLASATETQLDVPVTPSEEAVTVPETSDALAGPAESPFILDAKVEKRPLNAGTPADPPFDLTAELGASPANEPVQEDVPYNLDTTKADEPPLSPQMPELRSDLVAIESDEDAEATQAVETPVAAVQVAQPATPLGAASIPQQYTAQESSGDKSHAAIYDASQYPEPVSHPVKHKSGWLWVLWVIVLLGVGAGGAFLLYYLGIIP